MVVKITTPPIDQNKVAEFHRGIGTCVTIWSVIEISLCSLLLNLISPLETKRRHAPLKIKRRQALSGAFYSALAFDQKLKMVEAAAQFTMPQEYVSEWMALRQRLTNGAKTRNHIAHFQINWSGHKNDPSSFALGLEPSIMNSLASLKTRKSRNTQRDLDYISNGFRVLAGDLMKVVPKISPRSPAK